MNLRISEKDSSSTEDDIDHVLIGMSTSSEDYHPTVVIHGSFFFPFFFKKKKNWNIQIFQNNISFDENSSRSIS